MDSLHFLEADGSGKLQPLYVLVGDEDFLKRRVLDALRSLVFGPRGDEFGLSRYAGDTATFAAVIDELSTAPFLSACRLVVVDNADPFVSAHRAALEKYVGRRASAGVLVLDVRTWPATTRLAKLVDKDATIVCKAPPAYKLADWCMRWSDSRYGKRLALPAAGLLVELIGTDMGQLDQELAKLAIYAGAATRIDAQDVDLLVGASRSASAFKIFDAMAGGQQAEALRILDRLFEQGEEPLRILAAFSLQLRRLAQAARLTQQGQSLAAALDDVGIPPFARQGSEQQLRYLGRGRTDKLYGWLLEADLGLKGSSQLPPRTLLERLVVQLSRIAPTAGAS